MASIAGALVLNMGTLRPEEVEAMLLAGKSANANVTTQPLVGVFLFY